MFDHIRRAASRFVQRLFPATGHHRRRPPVQRPLTRTTSPSAALRVARRASAPAATAVPVIRAEEIPLVRPYLLSAEEWARRRGEALLYAGAAVPAA